MLGVLRGAPSCGRNRRSTVAKDRLVGRSSYTLWPSVLRSLVREATSVRHALMPAPDPASLLCFAPVPAFVAAGVVGVACRMFSMLMKQTADFWADAPAGQGARGLEAVAALQLFLTPRGRFSGTQGQGAGAICCTDARHDPCKAPCWVASPAEAISECISAGEC